MIMRCVNIPFSGYKTLIGTSIFSANYVVNKTEKRVLNPVVEILRTMLKIGI
jgi:hypothetical protein